MLRICMSLLSFVSGWHAQWLHELHRERSERNVLMSGAPKYQDPLDLVVKGQEGSLVRYDTICDAVRADPRYWIKEMVRALVMCRGKSM